MEHMDKMINKIVEAIKKPVMKYGVPLTLELALLFSPIIGYAKDSGDKVKIETKKTPTTFKAKGTVTLYDCAQKKSLEDTLKDLNGESFFQYSIIRHDKAVYHVFTSEKKPIGYFERENELILNREGAGKSCDKCIVNIPNRDMLKKVLRSYLAPKGNWVIYSIPTQNEVIVVPANAFVSCAHGDPTVKITYFPKAATEAATEAPASQPPTPEKVPTTEVPQTTTETEVPMEGTAGGVQPTEPTKSTEVAKKPINKYLELKTHFGYERKDIRTDTLVPDEQGILKRTEQNTALDDKFIDFGLKLKIGRIFLIGGASYETGKGTSGKDALEEILNSYNGGFALKVFDFKKKGYLQLGATVEGRSNEFNVVGGLWNANRKDRLLGYGIHLIGNKLPRDSEFEAKYSKLDGIKNVTTITDLSAFGRPNNIAKESQHLSLKELALNGETYLVDFGSGRFGIVYGYTNRTQKEGGNKINEEMFKGGLKVKFANFFGIEGGYIRRTFDSNDPQVIDRDGQTIYALFELNID